MSVGLLKLLRPAYADNAAAGGESFQTRVKRAVEIDSKLSIDAAIFAQYYVLKRLNEQPQDPFGGLLKFDQTFFNRCKNVVSTPVLGAQQLRQAGLPPGFQAAREAYNHLLPAVHQPVQRPASLHPVRLVRLTALH